MSVFDNIKTFFKPKTTEIVRKDSLANPSESLFYSLGAWPSNTGVPTSPLASMQVAAAYACIRALCDDLSKLPIRVQRKLTKGGWQDMPAHPAQKLLKYPNDFQSGSDLVSHLVNGVCLNGNGYAYADRGFNGSVRRLLPILWYRCTVMIGPEGQVLYNASTQHIPDEVIDCTPEDMVHLKNMSLDGGIRGVSPIAFAQDSLGIALAAQRHAALLFRQGTMPTGVLKVPGELSEQAQMRLSQTFQQAFSGSDNAHKAIVLEGGTDYNPIQFSPEDVQLLESRQFSVEEVCRIFGVPPHRIFKLDRATFNNIEQMQQGYVDSSLMPIANKIEHQLERVLFFDEERDDLRIRFDFDEMLRGDSATRYKNYQSAILTGWMNRNEVRAEEGMPPINGGDDYLVPLNTAPINPTPGTAPLGDEPDSTDEPKKERRTRSKSSYSK